MAKKANKKEKYDPVSEIQGKEKTKREVFEWISTFAQALFGVVIVFTFLFRFVTVDGESMQNTLQDLDRLIISDLNYTPERGDIVVIHNPEEEKFSGPIIKRVIATEGEIVEVDYNYKKLYVTDVSGNRYELVESYIKEFDNNFPKKWDKPTASYYKQAIELAEQTEFNQIGELTYATFRVGKGEVFVCGDNRANSSDSRYVGTVDQRQILGKVLFRVFPNPAVMNHTDYEVKGDKLVAKK